MMTIEEKAKAYDEALEKVRPMYQRAKENDNPSYAVYEDLFPELKESEDEKIRRALIEVSREVAQKQFFINRGTTLEDALAYLEKHKDSDKAMSAIEKIDKYIDTHTANAHDMYDSNPDKKYYQGWDNALGEITGILQDVYSNEKQKEQEPAEWSEDIIRKAVKEVGLTQHQIDWFKTNVFPPKQEWSKEDEYKLNFLTEMLEGLDQRKFDTRYMKELSSWLKSLRPQSQWKPSKEQMRFLLAVINDPNNIGAESCYMTIKSLYNDLKKLM